MLPALPRSVGLGPIRSPPTRLAHGSVRRLPFPVHAAQLFVLFHQDSPHSAQDTQFHPPLKGAMDGAVVPKLSRQSVPLASAAQPEDDAVEHLSGTSPLAASGLGRVFLQDDRLDQFPKLVRHFPDGS